MANSLGDGLDVAERSLASANGDQRQRLVDAAKRRHIDGLNERYEEAEESEVLNASGWIRKACLVHGWDLVHGWELVCVRVNVYLTTCNTSGADTGGILAGRRLLDGIGKNLE